MLRAWRVTAKTNKGDRKIAKPLMLEVPSCRGALGLTGVMKGSLAVRSGRVSSHRWPARESAWEG